MKTMRAIVLIDDNEADLEYSRIVLERSGLVTLVHSFDSAARALEWFDTPAAAMVDGVLLDINMPGMNGFEFLEAYQARSSGSAQPAVVMLTSSAAIEDREQAGRFPCVRGFLTKPLRRGEVAALVDLFEA